MKAHLLRDRAVYLEHARTRARTIWTRPVDPTVDVELVAAWMHDPEVEKYWAMAWPSERIADYLAADAANPHREAFVTFVDDTPVGYLEVYDPAHDVLAAHYPVEPGDVGAHVLIGDKDYRGRYSVSLGLATNRFLFGRPGVRRIVGEPDLRNHNFLSLLAFLGFHKAAEIDLPDKRAALMICERATFERLSSGPRQRTTARN